MLKEQKGFSTILIVIIALVIVAGGILIWQYWPGEPVEQADEDQIAEQDQIEATQPDTEQPVIDEEVDETADWPASNASRSDAGWQTYHNEEYGFEIKYPLNFWINQNGEIYLSSGSNRIYISVGNSLSVPLDGTFGGRYQYLENQPPNSKVFSEKDNDFTKDYFLAYSGMGSWDTVINVYQQRNESYYIISFYRGRQLGAPGATVAGGKQLSEEEIISQTLVEMRDKNDEHTKTFNQILSTFKFID